MIDISHKAETFMSPQYSPKYFNRAAWKAQVLAAAERRQAAKERTFSIPVSVLREQTARRIRAAYTQPPPPTEWEGRKCKHHDKPKEFVAFEFKAGSSYIDAYVETDDVTFLKNGVAVHDLPAGFTLPEGLTRNTYPTAYESPEYIALQSEQASWATYKRDDMQKLVWVKSADGGLYVFRLKDLSGHPTNLNDRPETDGRKLAPAIIPRKYAYRSKVRECPDCKGTGQITEPVIGLDHDLTTKKDQVKKVTCTFCKNGQITAKWQGPQTDLRLRFVPTEIYAWIQHPQGTTINIHGIIGSHKGHWEKVGNLAEEQTLAHINQGPTVQPGRLELVPYFETDQDDDYNGFDQDNLDSPEMLRAAVG